jgi:CRP-like cAMP-binding protein
MQVAGYGYSTPMRLAAQEFKRDEIFRGLTLHYVQGQLAQCAQMAACNAYHNIEQRMARWLLLCAGCLNRLTLPLTHDRMADMIGVTRASLSIVAGQLKKKGLIAYSRGRLTLVDLSGLELVACECYRIVRGHFTS